MKPWSKFPLAKYRNVKTEVDGIKFDSKKEAGRWRGLKMLESIGKISNLARQVSFELVPAVVIAGKKQRPVRYVADFAYDDQDGNRVIEDAKGVRLPEYVIKRKLMKHVLGIDVIEV